MDVILLQALRHRGKYNSLKHAVPHTMVSTDTSAMLAWFGAYFNAFPERDYVDVDELRSLVRLRAGAASVESVAMLMHLLTRLEEPADETAVNGILGQLYELDLSGRAAALITRYQDGEDVDLAYELQRLSQTAVRAKAAATPDDYIQVGIDELLSEVSNDQGLKFRRIPALRENILGLSGGASVAIAARPDKGKTSFLASILTDFAPQVQSMYGDARPILWLNNEGSGKRIIPRVYQAALGLDLDEIIALSNKGVLVQEYAKAVGGNANIIRVKEIHGASLAQIEQVIEAQRPAVVVADMLANVRIASTGGNKAEVVEQLWQEWRELMVRHDCIGLATVQVSAEGDNQLYPPYSALKDSKTGIQGATDIILVMGSLNNPEAASIRGLSTPKNKFAAPGKPSHITTEVYFDSPRCTFSAGS